MISVAIDSGAAETVVPQTMVTEYPIRPSEKVRVGSLLCKCNWGADPESGGTGTPNGNSRSFAARNDIPGCTGCEPLGSVKWIWQAGHALIFDSAGSYIINKKTGELNWLREENINFMLDG